VFVLMRQDRVLGSLLALGSFSDLLVKQEAITVHDGGYLSRIHSVQLGDGMCEFSQKPLFFKAENR
jgi:hypothetical protein